MLKKIYPRGHVRLMPLPLLGPHVEEFVEWLVAEGYPPLPIRRRLRRVPEVDELLRQQGAARIEEFTSGDILRLAPKDSQEDVYLSAVVRSLERCFSVKGLLACPSPTPQKELICAYVAYLDSVRGLVASTRAHHAATAGELLEHLGFEGDPVSLRDTGPRDIEALVRKVGVRRSRASLQHTVAQLRSFLRFLASRGLVAAGLDASIDTPRLYRGERLPRSLPWEAVRAFLAAIDRSIPMGKRDYAMFLLIATYGLRTCEVACLRLDDVHWRTQRLHIAQSKTRSPLVHPLTDEVGGALIDYIRHARPGLRHRRLFFRVRAPVGPLRPATVTDAFQGWVRRSGLPIPHQGPHCLRHSLAVHLLRQGAALKTIGDLLGHRSIESTCVYLRLHVEDLRGVALDLPQEVQP